VIPRLVGMVHLGPLPGAPGFDGDLDRVLKAAVADAGILQEAGFGAVLVENFGDAPFYGASVPPITVAAMTRAVAEVAGAVSLQVGVNVLRNDAESALAVAAAAGGSFIRVNVLSGTMVTDQGLLTGKAAEVARLRVAVAPDVAILADVFVKHAVPPPGLTIEQAAADLWERAAADAIVVSGPATGEPVDGEQLGAVAAAVPDAPLIAGSGVDAANVRAVLEACHGVIVGTSVKVGGRTTAPVDPDRARALVEAAGP
jgi:uncharacterized protein